MNRCPICGTELTAGQVRCPRDGLLLSAAEDPLIGATLAGRYRILARLARGGMASVYLARHVLIERICAIKILRRDLCDDPVQRDRFLREARAVNRINHENIVEIIDYGESEEGRVFLVMEYLPGQSLAQRLNHAGAMAPAQALDVAIQIASGLARAHQMGVVHRDLKPDNILLVPTDDGRDLVKVLDFGIAKMLDQPSLTANDKIFGTPGYIAPEYANGAPIDGRADLYSLGCVLYEMVTAALPFDAEYAGDLLLKHMLEPPIPPIERDPYLPPALNALILQALEKDPARRFRDAHHMLEELGRVLDAIESGASGGHDDAPRVTTVPPPPDVRVPTPERAIDTLSVPPVEIGGGVQGAVAWSRYMDTLRRAIEEKYGEMRRPATLAAHLGRMDALCSEMSERIERISVLKSRMLALEARGRDFRTTIGRAMDVLSAELSTRTRERDAISDERDQLGKRREDLTARARAGDRRAAGESDALLWQLAASDEVLRQTVGSCEDVEYQLRELGHQLDRLSEALEVDQSELVADIDSTFRQLTRDDVALRRLANDVPSE